MFDGDKNTEKPMETHDSHPECERCRRPMKLAADISRLGASAGMRVYMCEACGSVADKPTDGRKRNR